MDGEHVSLDAGPVRSPVGAVAAAERLFPRVGADVPSEVPRRGVLLLAYWARVGIWGAPGSLQYASE